MMNICGCTEDETLEELKAAAFEALLLNPGCDRADWAEAFATDASVQMYYDLT